MESGCRRKVGMVYSSDCDERQAWRGNEVDPGLAIK